MSDKNINFTTYTVDSFLNPILYLQVEIDKFYNFVYNTP